MSAPRRVAMLSVHACPLAAVGSGKAGGMNVYVREVAAHLARLGVSVDVFVRGHGECSGASGPDGDGARPSTVGEIAPGARVVHIPAGDDPDLSPHEIFPHMSEFTQRVCAFAEREGLSYDAIHAHYWLSGWAGGVLSRRWRVPLLMTYHTLAEVKRLATTGQEEPPVRARVERRAAAIAARVVAFTEHERDLLHRLYDVPPEKVHIVPAGVELGRFRPLPRDEARRQLGLGSEHVLLYVGRIEALKGLEVLVRTLAALETSRPVKVLVVGGGSSQGREVDHIRAVAAGLGVDRALRFDGVVPQEQLPLYYSAADIVVVPSFYESFGLVAVEAMACGAPVVAARVGGLATTVRHGSTGYLVRGHCPEPYANAIEVLLLNPDLRQAMGQAGRQRAQMMGWDRVAERLLAQYDEAARAR